MVCKLRLIILFWVLGFAAPATAQHAELDGIEIRPSGEAYLSAIRLRGVDSEVVYYDPTRPAPPLETRQALRADREALEIDGPQGSISGDGIRVSTMMIFSLILLGIVYLFVAYGGRLPLSFGRAPEDGKRGHQRTGPATKNRDATPLGVDAVLRMSDRRAALVALCKTLLARTVSAQGILLQDSWTDRDALRCVPRTLAQRDALQALVFASERVQFGGRDVTEEEFKEHVTRLRPLWIGQSA